MEIRWLPIMSESGRRLYRRGIDHLSAARHIKGFTVHRNFEFFGDDIFDRFFRAKKWKTGVKEETMVK